MKFIHLSDPRTRGSGTTTQKAEALLTGPGGPMANKWREVNAAIRDILGIDRRQPGGDPGGMR